MNYPPTQKPRSIFNHLQNAYQDESNQHSALEASKKNIYHRIAELEGVRNSQRKKVQKQLKEQQNRKIRDIWEKNNQRYLQERKRKKAEVDDVRRVNQNMSLEIMTPKKEEYQPYNYFNDFCQHEFQKQKRQREQLYKQGKEQFEIRKQKEKKQKLINMHVEKLKQIEQQELRLKREADLRRIRQKHQQNFQIYHQYDETMKRKKSQEQKLEDIIVNKGASDQQHRMFEMRAQFEAKEKQRRESYIRDLKSQLDGDTHREQEHKISNIMSQRKQIEERNKYFSLLEGNDKLKKKEEDKKTRQILKNQMKPRILLQQSDKMEAVGIGSPVNIGKVIGDDRKRQLEWIQKNLLRQIPY